MRINKFVGVGLLVVVLAVGSVVAGLAAEKDVTANFTIPDYIAIYAPSATVALVDSEGSGVTGPGTYSAENTLYVVSTKAWSVSEANVTWGTTPATGGEDLFSVTYDGASGTAGWDGFTATYELDLSGAAGANGEGNAMRYFPAGSYVVTVTHTVTTNSGSGT